MKFSEMKRGREKVKKILSNQTNTNKCGECKSNTKPKVDIHLKKYLFGRILTTPGAADDSDNHAAHSGVDIGCSCPTTDSTLSSTDHNMVNDKIKTNQQFKLTEQFRMSCDIVQNKSSS